MIKIYNSGYKSITLATFTVVILVVFYAKSQNSHKWLDGQNLLCTLQKKSFLIILKNNIITK